MDRIRITMFDISLMSLRNVRASFNCSARMSLDSLTRGRSEEHTSELQSHLNLVCRLLLEKKKSQFYRSGRKPLRSRRGEHLRLGVGASRSSSIVCRFSYVVLQTIMHRARFIIA